MHINKIIFIAALQLIFTHAATAQVQEDVIMPDPAPGPTSVQIFRKRIALRQILSPENFSILDTASEPSIEADRKIGKGDFEKVAKNEESVYSIELVSAANYFVKNSELLKLGRLTTRDELLDQLVKFEFVNINEELQKIVDIDLLKKIDVLENPDLGADNQISRRDLEICYESKQFSDNIRMACLILSSNLVFDYINYPEKKRTVDFGSIFATLTIRASVSNFAKYAKTLLTAIKKAPNALKKEFYTKEDLIFLANSDVLSSDERTAAAYFGYSHKNFGIAETAYLSDAPDGRLAREDLKAIIINL